MIKNVAIILLILLFCQNILGQIYLTNSDGSSLANGRQISEIDTADIDKDHITDTLYYDFQKQSIIILLSSRNYFPMSIGWELNLDDCILAATNGGISFSQIHLRSEEYLQFDYEKETSRFRLSRIDKQGHNVSDFWDTSIDLPTATFVADWEYRDEELDSIISIPTIQTFFFNPPVYLDDSVWIIDDSQEDELYRFYRNKSMVDTRISAIPANRQLETKIPSIPFFESSVHSIDSLIMKYGMNMGYNKQRQYTTISNSTIGNEENYTANIVALPPYKQYKLFLLSFNFEFGSSGIVIHMLEKNGKCSDTLSFWYDKEKEESIYFTTDNHYRIVVEKKKGQTTSELLKYFIDTLQCKFIEKK